MIETRLEKHYDQWVLCGAILPKELIAPYQAWQGSSGNIVFIDSVEDEWVNYYWYENGEKVEHSKDVFSFQCRYCLVIE